MKTLLAQYSDPSPKDLDLYYIEYTCDECGNFGFNVLQIPYGDEPLQSEVDKVLTDGCSNCGR